MAKRSAIKASKAAPLSQLLIAGTVVVVFVALYETVTRNYFTQVAPTQLFIVAVVLGILGLYLKDEK